MTTIHFLNILHRGTRFSAVSAALVLLLASCSKNGGSPENEAGGDLSVASITIEGTFTRASFDDNSSASEGWKPNHVINGFTSGDKLLMSYSFGGSGSYAADLTLGEDGGWSIGNCSFSGYSDRSHPSRPSEGESWAGAKVSIAALPLGSNGSVLSGDNHGGFNFHSVTTADDGTQVKRFYDVMTAGFQPTSETMAPKGSDVANGTINSADGLPYAVFIDNSTSSKGVGSVTAKLYHANALLRVNAGSALSVSGFKKGYSKLTGMTAAVGNDVIAFDLVSVQKNGSTVNYWQAIAPVGETLTSFTPTVSTEDGSASATLAPIVLTGASLKKLAGNNRYDITLRITPSSGDEPDLSVSITIPSLPGWDVYDETELENDKNDKDIELVTPAAEDEFFGTADYYAIYTAAGLEVFKSIVNYDFKGNEYVNPDGSIVQRNNDCKANAKLMKNINLSSVCGESIGSWTPIGDLSCYVEDGGYNGYNDYGGKFDGNGKSISGLYINSESGLIGLFGLIEGVVSNLTVNGVDDKVAVNSTGSSVYAGILAGCNYGTISCCKVTGLVIGTTATGGIVGYNQNSGIIAECQASGDVSGSEQSQNGGLVGLNSGTINDCQATGDVSGNEGSHNGGLAGENRKGTINDCQATGYVSGNEGSHNGGLIGWNFGGKISGCNASGNVSGDRSSNNGGLVGPNSDGGAIRNCQASGNVSGGINSINGGLTGNNSKSSISDCHAIGIVSGGQSSCNGGLLGENTGIITASFASGDVYGEFSGGFVETNGLNIDNAMSIIVACYSTGSTSGDYCGGFTFRNNGSIISCYSTRKGSDDSSGFVTDSPGTIQNCLSIYNNKSLSGTTDCYSGVSAEDLNSESPASGHGFGLLNAGIKKWNSTAGDGGAPLADTDSKYCAFHWVAGVSPFTTPQIAEGAPE